MTPDRMRAWIRKIPTGAKRLQLTHDTVTGQVPLTEWTREEVKDNDGAGATDVVDEITQVCEDLAESEGVLSRFNIRWLGDKDRTLKTTTHRVKPDAVEEDAGPGLASTAPSAQESVWIKELLRALIEKDKQLNAAYRTSLEANDKTILMLTRQSEDSFKQMHELRAEKATREEHATDEAEQTAEQREETMQRAKAWEKLGDILPDFAELGIAAALAKVAELQANAKKAEGPASNSNGSNGAPKEAATA